MKGRIRKGSLDIVRVLRHGKNKLQISNDNLPKKTKNRKNTFWHGLSLDPFHTRPFKYKKAVIQGNH